MNILFTINAPKQLYMFNIIGNILQKRDNTVNYLVRDYGPNKYLCNKLLKNYYFYGKPNFNGLIGKSYEFFYNFFSSLPTSLLIKPDIIIGDTLLGYNARLQRIPSITSIDGDTNGINYYLHNFIYQSNCYIIPEYIYFSAKKRNIIKYRGLQELVYLHPKYFTPNNNIFNYLPIKFPHKYILLRLSKLGMSHDIGLHTLNLSQIEYLVSRLEKYHPVYISTEKQLTKNLQKHIVIVPPQYFHSLQHNASLFLSDTASSVEAALLGVPSLQLSPIDQNKIPVFNQYGTFSIMKDSGLIKILSVDNINDIVENSVNILTDSTAVKKHKEKLDLFINKQIDATLFFSDFIENYPDSINYFNKFSSFYPKYKYSI